MKLSLRTLLSTSALLAAGGYLLFSFLGPDGVPMVLEKRRQIRELQRQNADVQKEIRDRRARIQDLSESPTEQDRKVREELRLLKKDETTFVLQDQKRLTRVIP